MSDSNRLLPWFRGMLPAPDATDLVLLAVGMMLGAAWIAALGV